MRLINTKTKKLEEYSDDKIPAYAILSHTWGDVSEELTFSDVEYGRANKPGVGSFKFQQCCLQAEKDNLEYAWIDTCCIDKANLVELGEAINSMFRWYSHAAVCYAYLSDVSEGDNPSEDGSDFQTSRWFKRGWTLQELLAPKYLQFYDSEWSYIGTKGTRCTVIQKVTHVPRHFLLGVAELHTASVAQRMSWAAQRGTTRAEDLAYCLLGIFGITMPMIYGEGGKQAFFRLQEQIMKTTRDDSILAWGLNSEIKEPSTDSPSQIVDGEILAATPSDFANSGRIITREQATNPLHSLDIFGGSLRVYLPLITTPAGDTFGLLSCGPGSDAQQAVAIPLAKINSAVANEYVRPRGCPSVLQPIDEYDALPELIHIKRDGQKNISLKNQQYLFYEDGLFAKFGLTLIDVAPQSCWDKQLALISVISDSNNVTAPILLRARHSKEGSQDFVIILEFQSMDSRTNPQCSIVVCRRETPLEEIAKGCQQMTLDEFKEKDASNGPLHLKIILEPIEGMMILIKLESMAHPPGYTINADMVMENMDLVVESTQLLQKRRQTQTEIDTVNQGMENGSDHLKRIMEEQEMMDSEIKELEAKRGMLVEEGKRKVQELQDLEDERVEARTRQYETSQQLVRAQNRLDELHHAEGCENGWTLFRWATECSDFEMMKLLLDGGINMVAAEMYEYMRWVPLAAASKKGDVDAVQLLLSTNGAQPDCKDSRFGRTPLSWASMKGHEAVVRLLLDTGKVNVNSRDVSGQTPLHWALEGGHQDVEQLLLDKGAGSDCIRTFGGHWGAVISVAFSHDSKLVVSGFKDGTVKLWDSITGQCLQALRGHTNSVSSVAFSHDSKLIVSGSFDKTIKLWDSTTGQCYQTLHGHTNIIISVAFSHDSKLIASGSSNKTIKLWDSSTGQCYQTLQGHTSSVISVAFSHDSKLIASGSYDKTIKLWDSTTGQCRQTLQHHTDKVGSVAFSYDSKLVVSGSYDKTIKLWDSTTGQCYQTLQHHTDKVGSVAFSHDSKLVVSGSYDKTIKLWDSTTGQCRQTLQGHTKSISSVAFSHDSKLVVSASYDSTIQLWDTSIIYDLVTSSRYQNNVGPEKKRKIGNYLDP